MRRVPPDHFSVVLAVPGTAGEPAFLRRDITGHLDRRQIAESTMRRSSFCARGLVLPVKSTAAPALQNRSQCAALFLSIPETLNG